jgi:peptidoglycan/LPS O-acetylase OafA/YrhL
MTPPPLPTRRHDLDALRAVAMLLGIALHAALSFTGGPWTVQDSRSSPAFHLFFEAIHGFRMPLFFLLSGFFTAMLWRQKGLRALLAHRFQRVFLPLLLGLITIIPLTNWIAATAAQSAAARPNPVAANSTPDLWTASTTGNSPLVTSLIKDGADPNAQDPTFGITPLSLAAIHDHTESVRLLLAQGADPRRPNRDGATALHAAAFFGRPEIARLLLDANADPLATNLRGESALDATNADEPTTEFIASLLKVSLNPAAVRDGRNAIRAMLGAPPIAAPSPLTAFSQFLRYHPLLHHLWFLWFLCWMFAGFATWARIANRIGWRQKPRPSLDSPLPLLWLIPLTAIPAWFMGRDFPSFGPDTSTSLLPPLHLLTYYAIFFAFGALWFDSRTSTQGIGRFWKISLPLALLIILPAGLHTTFITSSHAAATFLKVTYSWSMCFAMIGLFQHVASSERPWLRYLSDASYWMYLAHLPLVFAAQLIVRDWPMPPAWKFLIVSTSVFIILLTTYHSLVRYSWLGALLNSRKSRPAPSPQP